MLATRHKTMASTRHIGVQDTAFIGRQLTMKTNDNRCWSWATFVQEQYEQIQTPSVLLRGDAFQIGSSQCVLSNTVETICDAHGGLEATQPPGRRAVMRWRTRKGGNEAVGCRRAAVFQSVRFGTEKTGLITSFATSATSGGIGIY